jgi:Leucine-rich repeat (LRR) protein
MNKLVLVIGAIISIGLVIVIGQNVGFLKIIDRSPDGDMGEAVNKDITLPKGKTVDLSGQKLKSIPSGIFNQKDIEELNVSNNLLTGAIQSQIGQLSNLRVLNASNNLMTGVPAEIGQLQDLEILNLSNNLLTGLPNELGNLKKLETLDLSGNQYSEQDLNYIRGKLSSSVNIIVD